MRKVEVEVFSEQTNSSVIRLLTRKYPGILIQGDSLRILHDCVQEILDLQQADQLKEQPETILRVLDILQSYLSNYEESLSQNHIDLPYPSTIR